MTKKKTQLKVVYDTSDLAELIYEKFNENWSIYFIQRICYVSI